MWSSSNDYGLNGIGGDRPLGEYTAIQQQMRLLYQLATELQKNGQIFANIDPNEETFQLGQGDEATAMLYGLKPYMVAQPLGTPTSMVRSPAQIGGAMQPQLLKSLLRRIVEES